ncbi:unnamed protein product [Gemmata massiliana]|uniref:Uncharacterized protein n=1 Tax=Gemmata massiliana TaxID=1210884 RepID=A0A6P2CWI7_9BACT|nr:hypothetical protein [Gemmata massiliana]VTR92515.1 unnamed protein product [Gemmata massiliana]
MSMRNRLSKLEQLAPERRARRRHVPTESLSAFARGLLTGAFEIEDIDRASIDQTSLLAELSACLLVMSPEHQAWEAATGWTCRSDRDWARAKFDGLTPEELDALWASAANFTYARRPSEETRTTFPDGVTTDAEDQNP